jgi:tetratricopeptide (TPR) repeat protein
MKSERRHELERNQLLVWLMETFGEIKPYANAILTAVLVVLVAALAYTLWNRQAESRFSQGWDDYFTALNGMDRTALENVAQKHPGTAPAHWALVTVADMQLQEGCNLLFVNKTSANLDLRKAVENYQAVLAQATTPALLERANYGLGRAREAQGDLEQALKAYREVVQQWPNGAFGQSAAERVKDLTSQPTRSFYDKFAKFDPKPPMADQPGTPGKKPAFDLDALPDSPAFKLGESKKESAKPEAKKEAPVKSAAKKELAKPEAKQGEPAKPQPKK